MHVCSRCMWGRSTLCVSVWGQTGQASLGLRRFQEPACVLGCGAPASTRASFPIFPVCSESSSQDAYFDK